ncbi:MAG: D-2-hydroxyacid dehydrogenase, partial [Bacteroidota bacterium]
MATKIVYLDCYTLNPGDLSWDTLLELGDVDLYEETSNNLILQRSKDAEIILINKIAFDGDLMDQLPKLKCICVTATGYNIIDVAAAKQRGIIVCNVVG